MDYYMGAFILRIATFVVPGVLAFLILVWLMELNPPATSQSTALKEYLKLVPGVVLVYVLAAVLLTGAGL